MDAVAWMLILAYPGLIVALIVWGVYFAQPLNSAEAGTEQQGPSLEPLSGKAGTEQKRPNLEWLQWICVLTLPVGFRLLSRRRFHPNSDQSVTYSYGTIMMAMGCIGYMAALFVFSEWKGLEKVSWWLVCLGYFVGFVLATMVAHEDEQRGGLSSRMSHTTTRHHETDEHRGWTCLDVASWLMMLIGSSFFAEYYVWRGNQARDVPTLPAEEMEQQLMDQQRWNMRLLWWIGFVMATVGLRLAARRRIRRNAKASEIDETGMAAMICGVFVYFVALFFSLFTAKVFWWLIISVGDLVFGFGYLQGVIIAPMEALASDVDNKKKRSDAKEYDDYDNDENDDGDDDDDVMTSCRHYGVHTKTWKQQKRGQRHLPRSWTFLFRRHRQHTTSSSLLKT